MNFTLTTPDGELRNLPADLGPLLGALVGEDGNFFVLSESDDADGSYLQGSCDADGSFQLEYFDSSEDKAFAYGIALPLPVVIEIANRYLLGDLAWRQLPEWQEIEAVEPHEPDDPVGKDVWIGTFDGVGLRRAIKEMERMEIDFRLQPNPQAGFGYFDIITVYEQRSEARELIHDVFFA